MATVTICSDLGDQKNSCFLGNFFHWFTIYLPGSDGTRCPSGQIFVFWMLSFQPKFSLSYFTFIKRFFSSSLSAIRWCHLHIWGYWYFSRQSWFQLMLHPALAFLMMYSAYKLNKQGGNRQLWHTPFPICNESVVPCPVLTFAFWPAYRFLKR